MSVKLLPPITVAFGDSRVMLGSGYCTAKVIGAETPPPGAEVETLTGKLPPEATSFAEIAADNWLLLTYVVAREEPFHKTVELLENPDPLTKSVKSPLPGATLTGDMD